MENVPREEIGVGRIEVFAGSEEESGGLLCSHVTGERDYEQGRRYRDS